MIRPTPGQGIARLCIAETYSCTLGTPSDSPKDVWVLDNGNTGEMQRFQLENHWVRGWAYRGAELSPDGQLRCMRTRLYVGQTVMRFTLTFGAEVPPPIPLLGGAIHCATPRSYVEYEHGEGNRWKSPALEDSHMTTVKVRIYDDGEALLTDRHGRSYPVEAQNHPDLTRSGPDPA